jgi:hypothetical protein
MPRFSIRQLFAATALVAVGCLALVKPSALLAATMMGVVALALLAAVVFTIYRSGDKRAFWLGFAVFGWSYLLLCYGPIFTENNSPFGWTRLVTARLATALYDRIHGSTVAQPTRFITTYTTAVDPFGAPPPLPPPTPGVPPPAPSGAMTVQVAPYAPSWPVTLQMATGPDRADFLNAAHSLWALLIALCGGWFAAWASRGSSRRNQASGEVS